MKVGVVYVSNKLRCCEDEIYANTVTSPEYQQFVRSLGWDINPATHTGFLGGLDRKLSTGFLIIIKNPLLMPNQGQ